MTAYLALPCLQQARLGKKTELMLQPAESMLDHSFVGFSFFVDLSLFKAKKEWKIEHKIPSSKTVV